jgi:methylated-DNA-[protein]-cysteine S-methyltransferase
MVQEVLSYCIFKTKWGYFGLAGSDTALLRSCLPGTREAVQEQLLRGLSGARQRRDYFSDLQERIVAYFDGALVAFGPEITIDLGALGEFSRRVLDACRAIDFGQTRAYSDLARVVGRPGASRVVGHALASNPVPLIIPCHRVVQSDGGLGGFTAPGGVAIKRRFLNHEQICLRRVGV